MQYHRHHKNDRSTRTQDVYSFEVDKLQITVVAKKYICVS